MEATQSALGKFNLLLSALFDNLEGWVLLLDNQGKVLKANASALDYLQCGEEDIFNTPFIDLPIWNRKVAEILHDTIRRVLEGFSQKIDLMLTSEMMLQAVLKPIKHHGSILGLTLEGKPHPKQENKQNFQTKLLEMVADNITTGLFMMDHEGRVTYMNHAAEKMTGYSKEEMKGEVLHDKIHYVHTDGSPFPIHDCKIGRTVLQSQIPLKNHEDVFIRKDGSFFPVMASSIPVISEGRVKEVVLEIQDLTERKKTEKVLEESRQRLDFALEASGAIGRYNWEITSDKVFSDENFATFFLVDPEKVKEGVPLEEFIKVIHKEDVANVEKAIEETLKSGKPYRIEYRIIQQDGSYKWVHAFGQIQYHDYTGEPLHFSGFVIDITERKQTELALKESEERFRQIVDSNIVGVLFWSADGKIQDANDAFLKTVGYTKEELKTGQLDWQKMTPEEWVEADRLAIEELLATGMKRPFEKQYFHKNGQRVDVLLGASKFPGDKPEGLAFVLDITDRKNTERELVQAQERFRTIVELLPGFTWMATPEGLLYYQSPRWYEYSGMEVEEPLGEKWIEYIHPEDRERSIQAWKQSLENKVPYQTTFRVRRHDGQYKWHLAQASPLYDERGEALRWIGICTNINQQKKIEQELLNTNEKLKKINLDLDNFIYTASHDLKAPISNIEGLIHALSDEMFEKCNAENKAIFGMIDHSIQKFKQTVLDLTEISKVQKGEDEVSENVPLPEIVEESMLAIQSLVKASRATIEMEFALDHIYFSKRNLRSIVYNLISNAIKYRAPHRSPHVVLRSYQEAEYVVLEVKDNGLGIDASKKDNLFKMFKRLHYHVEGSGIGLYIVKRIMDNAGGKIEVDSQLGEGTVFKLYFPR